MTEDRFQSLLADLGKATLRGVRKCPKCGTYNGSRGACCKNKYCDAIFKEPSERRKLSAEACKLITGSSTQVFSVRIRDKGPDYRGFVQLPIVNLISSSDVIASIAQNSALCFVDNCEKSFNNTVLQCHEKEASEILTSNCQHIQAALRCYAEAQPLTLRNSILSSLNVNNETKQEIWLLATETSGPLVQRVSKNIMAVKCKASSKHPLGYLHFSFFSTKFKDKIEHKFFCSCNSFKISCKANENKTDSATTRRCVHFYACICAFASEPKLSEEFQYYINLDKTDTVIQELLDFQFNTNETDKFVEMDLDSLSDDTHLLIFRDDPLAVENLQNDKLDIDNVDLDPLLLEGNIIDNMKTESHNLLDGTNRISEIQNLEVIDQNAVFDGNESIKTINGTAIKILDHNLIFDANSIKLIDSNSVSMDKNNSTLKIPVGRKINSVKRKREENKNLSPIINLNSIESRKSKTKTNSMKKYPNTCENVDESNTSLSFIRWLSSITERINQTMHFQFDGKPEPLVFHVPQAFFECLRERISCGTKKKRLPNSTIAFVRRDDVPLGTFTKYTWLITNILHVKSIFETPLVPLEITRSFVQNADGNYELYKREETEIDRYKKTSNNPLIKPLELKTYLKVGNTSPNQVQPTPFLIEWIPDILPISKIGELRIRFEFGHVKNESPQRKLSKNY
ncbi:PREDICTED: uncharacterized protein C2orf42 homolog isoform X2 [Ceratosolen solmsi marchali]|uniref:Uncharacterized protein C2orf42 homolog isoform X2 n=1 Tax=Ceratosolen solmsi marchali TaxID=326594 RepID=A0AAJ7E2B0_9HYME|nr:PREDICTED: uncharacterized protein C2orf42 homolog isoform X2 [Ceratosolen solmsi marchali]